MAPVRQPGGNAALFDLSGRVALVTGAARGLGFAMAEALGEAGAHLVLSDIDASATDAAVRGMVARGIAAEPMALDVIDADAIAAGLAAIGARHGRLDILVNNAGIALYGGVADHTLPDWRRVIEVDLTSLYAVTREAEPLMAANGYGRIINIASVLGLVARPGIISYVAAKHGVIGLTRSLATELGRYGITCNVIAPGYFNTPMGAELSRDSGFQRMISRRTPLGRWADPSELKGPVLFLAAPASSFVSGHVLTVDGGLTSSLFQIEPYLAEAAEPSS